MTHMADISAKQVKELRDATGAGILDCKKALTEADGDQARAVEILRTHGLADAQKKAGRTTNEGIIDSYIHLGGKIGVLVELNCETDFVARTEPFQELAHEICMQIAATDPTYVSRDDVPAAEIEQEERILKEQALSEGKPDEIAERIVAGRIEKYYGQICLLDQPYIRDADKTVEDLVKEAIATLGENININRFARFALGEDGESN